MNDDSSVSPAHPVSADWAVRAETPSDVPEVRRIVRAAFGRPDEADLVDALRDDPAWIDGLSVVAADRGGRPVGHALLTRCHIGTVPALCLAPCAVLPDYQRTGAGSAAVRAALDAAAAMGERYVTVLGHPEYYPRFGFGRASGHGVRLTVEVPDEALMVMALRPGDQVPPGTIRYAEPFGI
ncbi:GNAT family N-acetyltransferase [Nocardiopsis chromatogenes]|uniref:GNAT family N-acetyltransferase n=1 Tax=Nocardiopsis chromatogenes TaxID=280239 RepID=UPI00034C648F|nr:N-acetyltransferase [Nocardiopsis chromatogenes]